MPSPQQSSAAGSDRLSGAAGRTGSVVPDGRLRPLTPSERARYCRNILVPEVGEVGQQRIRAARVLVLGAGALGSPAILYLAAAGVGRLGIVDDDVVEVTNLQRQVVHTMEWIGRPKVDSAAAAVAALNPDVEVVTYRQALTVDTAGAILDGWDVVVDGTDNFATRYLVGDACVLAGIPLVHGAVLRSHGQVTVLAPSLGGPCYRCLHPVAPEPGTVPSCAEAGVLGVLPGMVGSAQATEALKLVVGGGSPLLGRLAVLDAWGGTTTQLAFQPSPTCPVCGPRPTITDLASLPDYEAVCGARVPGVVSLLGDAPGHACPPGAGVAAGAAAAGAAAGSAAARAAAGGEREWPGGGEMSAAELRGRLEAGALPGRDVTVLDVREPEEVATGVIDGAQCIPLRQVVARVRELDTNVPTVVVCAAGVRSARAIQALTAAGYTGVLINLAGGMRAWQEA